MISSNNEVAFEGFNALLSREAKEDFEEILLAYLSNHGTSVEQRTLTFESVRVTDQFIKESPSNKRTNTSTLHVVFDVAAFVTPQEDYSPFNYNRFVRSFFDNEATLDAFSTQLKNTSDHFGGDLKLVLTITGSEIIEAPEESEPSTPNKTSTLVASVAGATVFFGGLATILWLRRRGKESILAIEPSPSSCEDIEEQYALSVKPTETYDTGSYGDDTPSEMSSPTAGYPTPHMYYGTSTLTKRDLVPHEGIQSARSIDTEEHTLGTASMFRPTFLSAESNIEIPITPMTNHDLSLITPRDVEVEAFETWVPSPSQSDAADECLIHETTPGRSQWDPVRIFGFGMRSKQKKEKEMKEVEAKSMAEEVQFNEQCAAVRPCSSNFNQSRLSSANNISTFSPLFSDPSNMLKTAWHESRSAEIPPFDLDVWETKELPMSSSSQGSAPSVSSETHLTDTKTGRNTEDGKNSRANISMKLMNEDFQLNEVFDFHEQTASTHR